MQLKQSLLIAAVICSLSVLAWEVYWRSQGYYPTLNDEKSLWGVTRAKVEDATKEDVIVLGSSRAYFDIQVDEWEIITGKKPIQLSSTGSSPLPTFHDIVNNTNFTGTILIGVTPGLFFSTTYPKASPWSRPQSKVDFYQNRTYAQRLNYQLSIPLQKNLVLMSADEEEWADDIDLKSFLRSVKISDRTNEPVQPPFYYFGDVDSNRNMRMTTNASSDTVFANTIKKVWGFFGKGAPPPDKESTMNYFLEDLIKYKSKGGTVVLIRCPSSGGVRMGENMALPRAEFWDDLVMQTNVKAYHFEDYESLKNLTCPEESHLSGEDADYYTRELLKIMKADNAVTNL
jgi:hypothetical protein